MAGFWILDVPEGRADVCPDRLVVTCKRRAEPRQDPRNFGLIRSRPGQPDSSITWSFPPNPPRQQVPGRRWLSLITNCEDGKQEKKPNDPQSSVSDPVRLRELCPRFPLPLRMAPAL